MSEVTPRNQIARTCRSTLNPSGKITALVFCFLFFAITCGASAPAAPAVVKVKAALSRDRVPAGSRVALTLVAEIEPGYHINDHHPTLNYLIPTEIKLDPANQKGFAIDEVAYPPGKLERLAFSDVRLSVYEARIVIGASLRVGADVVPGEYTLKGTLDYQACNDHACLPPASAPFALKVNVLHSRTP